MKYRLAKTKPYTITSGVQRGFTGRQPRVSKTGVHPKIEIAKLHLNKML